MPAEASSTVDTPERGVAQDAIDEGNKAFALRKYEQAAEAYTRALEIFATKFGDFSAESSDLLLLYGKTLLEIAIAQNQVMRQEGGQGEDAGDDHDADEVEVDIKDAKKLSSYTTFQEEQPEVDGGATSSKAAEPASAEQADEEELPEDDFNAAWEVLDAARALFEKKTGPRARLQEAECFLILGDVSLETENFPQAVKDFTSAIALKAPILPTSSRQLSEAHLKLGMALEFCPEDGARASALKHIEQAKTCLLLRKSELDSGTSSYALQSEEGKGKGKADGEAVEPDLIRDQVEDMSAEARELEAKDIAELVQDLDVKIEDLRTAPLAEDAVSSLLSTSIAVPAPPIAGASVNDLSSMVKKKKVAPAPAEKRKADDGGDDADAKRSKTE